MPRATDLLALLGGFDPGPEPRAIRSLELTRGLLGQSSDPFSRSTFDPGHVTASGVVLTPDLGRVLLIFHRRLRRWLQPGGHVEPDDPDLVAAARREILEETGVRLDARVPPVMVGVDLHQIPARPDEPPHLHHDVVFRFIAEGDRVAPEWGREVRWCDVDRLDQWRPDETLRRSIDRARRAPRR